MDALVPHKHERWVMGAVILGGIMALIFGFSYLGKAITDPLKLKPQTFLTADEEAAKRTAELRTKDTDVDGLSDYDEIYVWRTSAYLADSDSDGQDDKAEIDSGNDPNCPSGRTCTLPGGTTAANADASGGTPTTAEGLFPPPAAEQLFGTGAFGNLGQVLTALPPNEIRKLLIENGVPEDVLAEISDDDLVRLYEESVAKALAELEEQAESVQE